MITRKDTTKEVQKSGSHWMLFAILSAIFASLTAILGKVGIEGVDSNLGTAIRTTVVLLMAWLMVFATGSAKGVRTIEKKELLFIAFPVLQPVCRGFAITKLCKMDRQVLSHRSTS